ncbi:hypothetical protein [Escherichia phage vB-EcoP-XT73]|nr:hypothetical protein [Escherichia phage vB-EcoP-XT73]
MLRVFSVGTPFKIIFMIVKFIAILMVDTWKIIRVRYVLTSNQPVDIEIL